MNRSRQLPTRRLRHVAIAFALTLAGLSAMPAGSTTVREMTLDELAALADSIVYATCTAAEPRWVNEKIFTESMLQIRETLKGNRTGQLTVTSLGGTASHPVLGAPVTMQVAGGVELRPGDEVVLFTRANHRGQNQVIGMSMGRFAVRTDPDSGEKRIVSPHKLLHGERVSARGGETTRVSPRDPTLDEFLQRVRETVARGGPDR